MRISVVIFISLVVNLTLAALLFRPGARPEANAGEVLMENSSIPAADSSTVGGDDRFVTTPAGVKTSWRDLQATELREFVRKLRAANCPEETIKDLALAEINRRYSAKTRSLWQDPEWLAQNNYWKPYQRKRQTEDRKK